MSYERRIDDMIGKHVAHFQDEMTMAKLMSQFQKKTPAMPYGYPMAVYHPLHVCRSPEVKQFIAHTGGRLSNGVPKVIGMEIVDQYILGLYNPRSPLRRSAFCRKTRHPDLEQWLTGFHQCKLQGRGPALPLKTRA